MHVAPPRRAAHGRAVPRADPQRVLHHPVGALAQRPEACVDRRRRRAVLLDERELVREPPVHAARVVGDAAGVLADERAGDHDERPEPVEGEYVTEIGLAARAWVAEWARCMQRGALLLIDYGYPRAEFYLPSRASGTLSGWVVRVTPRNPPESRPSISGVRQPFSQSIAITPPLPGPSLTASAVSSV